MRKRRAPPITIQTDSGTPTRETKGHSRKETGRDEARQAGSQATQLAQKREMHAARAEIRVCNDEQHKDGRQQRKQRRDCSEEESGPNEQDGTRRHSNHAHEGSQTHKTRETNGAADLKTAPWSRNTGCRLVDTAQSDKSD